jgi:LemA protein
MSFLFALLILVAVVVLFGGWAIGIYNALITTRNAYKNAFAQIDVQLSRRYDLIPNLVEVAKGYMSHERDTLEAVMRARAAAVSGLGAAKGNPGDPAAMQQLSAAEQGLGGALGRLMMISESYPDLKANQNMMQLTEELTSTENKVAFARQHYNDAVMEYNTYKQTFPPIFFAGLLGHGQDAELLDFDDAKINEAPKVSF